MKIILISGAFLAIFMAVLIFSKKQKTVSDFFLLSMFFLNALIISLAYAEVYNRQHEYPFPFLIHLSTPFILLHAPLLWLYLKSVTTLKFRFRLRYLFHFLPFFVVALLLVFSIFTLPAADRIASDATESFKKGLEFPFIIAIIFLTNMAYYAWCLIMRRNFKRTLKDYFSQTQGRDLQWLKILILSGIIFHASISILYILDYLFGLMDYEMLQLAGFSFASAFIVVLAFFGIRQGNVFIDRPMENFRDELLTADTTDIQLSVREKEFIDHLLDYMKTSKPWLEPDLTLDQLAGQMGAGSDFLSGIMNTHLHKNFFEFVNHYRVEEFKQLCRIPESRKLTIIALAYDAGFSSKTTFNRVFKNMTGKTPGEYFREKRIINELSNKI